MTMDSQVFLTFGIHPKAATGGKKILAQLECLLQEPKVVTIGELGLDYSRYPSEQQRKTQKQMLRFQLNIAVTNKLPIVLHSRGNEEESAILDCLTIFQEVVPRLHPIHFHCFLGNSSHYQRARKGQNGRSCQKDTSTEDGARDRLAFHHSCIHQVYPSCQSQNDLGSCSIHWQAEKSRYINGGGCNQESGSQILQHMNGWRINQHIDRLGGNGFGCSVTQLLVRAFC